jgi:conjugal transfer pilus assembly protein TraA
MFKFKFNNPFQLLFLSLFMFVLVLLFSALARSAPPSAPLSNVYIILAVSLGMILVGIVVWIARQSIMAFAAAIGGGKAWLFSGLVLFMFGVALLFPDLVQAASTSGPLSDVYTSLTEWSQGNVGKTISLGMILVGIVAGIARQSLMSFATGIGGGLGLYNASTIIDTVFNATLHAGMIYH